MAFIRILSNVNLSLNQILLNSGNYSVTGSVPLIRMDSVTHAHGLVVYVKEGLPFAWDLSLENSTDCDVFDWLYFTQYLPSFSSIKHLLCLYAQFLILSTQSSLNQLIC